MMIMRALTLLLFAVATVFAGAASAQTYPNRPITLVAPFPPGGATDTIARIMQDSLSQALGQQIVIENVGGAGGMIGAARAPRAAPHGYTVLLHNVAMAIGMTLYSKLSFDSEKDFVVVGAVNDAATTLSARPTLPPNSLPELVAWLKGPGQNAKMGHAGVGSYGHLCGMLFAREIGAQIDQIPYRGAGPALNDLLAGHADLSCQSAATAAPLITAGKLKGYAMLSKSRFAGLPDRPSAAEAGYPKLGLRFWHLLFAPVGTPRPIVDQLNAALRHSFADEKVAATFAKGGMELFPAAERTPEAGAAILKSEIKLWGDVIRATNITVQQ
jgi:tripartite-type tricarboxylate transporter receptor subunit TctC